DFGLPAAATGASAATDLAAAVRTLSPERRTEYDRRLKSIDLSYPPDRATVADLVNHIDYVVKLIGIDHVGISSDFDGGGGLTGWNDASETFNVTLEPVKRASSESQLAQLWSANLLRA